MRCPFAEWRGPIPNRSTGVQRPARGLVLHVIVGSLASADAAFHNPAWRASAHFGVGKDGTLYQWVDTDDKAWAQANGNADWYSVETEGTDKEPLTDAQLQTVARLLEWLSAIDHFPLQVTDDTNGSGLISHRDGGKAWGGHPCPGDKRHAQRGEIVTRALALRHPTPPLPMSTVTTFEDEMKLHVVPVPGLDATGRGYTDLPDVPAGTVVSVRVNTAGYKPVPDSPGDEDYGGHARIQWTGPANAPAFTARVWTAA